MAKAFCIVSCLLLLTAAGALGGEVNWQDVSLDLPQPERGKPFPDLELPDTDGVLTSLSRYRGKTVLVTFCACYADTACNVLRRIEALRKKYGRALDIVIVCTETAASWKSQGFEKLLQRTEGLVDAVLIDEEGRARVPYLVASYPTTYLVDEKFILRFRGTSIADLNGREFQAELERLVGGRGTGP